MHLRDLSQFLKELAENNNRPWFIMNKPRYDILREEFLETVTDLISEVARFDPLLAACNPKKALFRINRDVRFSNDKRPYKTRFSAALVPNDMKRPSVAGGPVYYLQIDDAGHLLFGAGEYLPPPARLAAIRCHIGADGAGFARMLSNRALKKRYGDLQIDAKLQRPPKGYDANHPHIEYIKLKSFFVWTEINLPQDEPQRLVPELAAGLKDALALVRWLRTVEVLEAPQ